MPFNNNGLSGLIFNAPSLIGKKDKEKKKIKKLCTNYDYLSSRFIFICEHTNLIESTKPRFLSTNIWSILSNEVFGLYSITTIYK
ncbi:hypothetical protein BpHYR1_023984 [Brachionus plicatilis]|uniref:Uncharacterized protein n=1 Tax=Brachionus plicatilis TaxID=10195 RepID=A0A3M7SHI7_BRAPC|nr:hypothetical protein BpHYR1_023984 [Brachionus plicatilis]